MQIPIPTPTPWATPSAPLITMPDMANFRIWSYADEAVAWWNRAGSSATQVIQIAVVLVIVVAGTLFIAKLVRSLSDENESET